ncbi:hypothetical protein Ancab_016169 [Ancistrocladus abbreviatus]
MAFWGIEVKPGKPFTHSFDKDSGRLRISQATLGIGTSTKRSLLQCNVGEKSPVLLCSLLPDKAESCHLELEFDEVDEVIFSVIGPRCIHLTGYYLGKASRHGYVDDDSDTYGEDIGNTDTERSDSCDDEDEYEDSFINDDDDLDVFPPPVSPCGVAGMEATGKKKLANGKGGRRRLKKKYQRSESDDDEFICQENISNGGRTSQVVESEEDQIPISSLYRSGKTSNSERLSQERVGEETADGKTGSCSNDVDKSNEENDAVIVNGNQKRKVVCPPNSLEASAELGQELTAEPKKKKKERVKNGIALKSDSNGGNNVCEEDRDLVDGGTADDMELAFPSKTEPQELADTKEVEFPCDPFPASAVAGQELRADRKKKRKERGKKGIGSKADSAICSNSCEDGSGQLGEGKTDMDQDLFVKTENQELADTKHMDGFADLAVDDHQLKDRNAKKRKRKSQKDSEEIADAEKSMMLAKEGADKKDMDVKPSEGMSFSNGLVIEELEMGKADGKVASSGKKVTVHSTLKFKVGVKEVWSRNKSGPMKFRLGNGQVIAGLVIGVDGMRVGGRRRLLIPPALGYGSAGSDDVPPNSWLIMDVELIRVH